MFERETNNHEPHKTYKKSTIIIWVIAVVAMAVGVKFLIKYLVMN